MFEKMNIFARPSLKILCFLGRRYDEVYYTRELVRILKIGLGSASKYLRILEENELILKEKRGKLSLYRANMENPLYKEIKVIFTLMEIEDMIKDLRRLSIQMILFGSCADGEDTEKSDIDIFILSEKGKQVNKVINQHQDSIGRKLSPVIFDQTELRILRGEDKPFYSRIKKGRLLHELSV